MAGIAADRTQRVIKGYRSHIIDFIKKHEVELQGKCCLQYLWTGLWVASVNYKPYLQMSNPVAGSLCMFLIVIRANFSRLLVSMCKKIAQTYRTRQDHNFELWHCPWEKSTKESVTTQPAMFQDWEKAHKFENSALRRNKIYGLGAICIGLEKPQNAYSGCWKIFLSPDQTVKTRWGDCYLKCKDTNTKL